MKKYGVCEGVGLGEEIILVRTLGKLSTLKENTWLFPGLHHPKI